MIRMSNNSLNRKRILPSAITDPPKRGFHVMQRGNCILCPNQHSLFTCPEYERKSIEERRAIIRKRNLCCNCLGNHRTSECASSQRCKTCDKRHHISLHPSPSMKPMHNSHEQPRATKDTDSRGGPFTGIHAHTAGIHTPTKLTLLATAIIGIINKHGMRMQVPALLDERSEVSFISESIVQLLALPKQCVEVMLTGIGACQADIARGITTFKISSLVAPEFSLSIRDLCSRLSAHIPSVNLVEIPLVDVTLPILADPHFNSPFHRHYIRC
jgi:hypothetical protein